MSSLYELENEYMALLMMAEDPETDPQAIADTLEGLDLEIEQKAEGYTKIIRQLDADAKMLMEEAQTFIKRADAASANAKRLKEALMRAMILTGNEKMNAGLFKLSVVNNGGMKPMAIIGDVPDAFIDMVPQRNNAAIRKFLEEQPNEECEWARLESRGRHLTIK